MDSENMTELRSLITAEPKRQQIVLDLSELLLVDEGSVRFLEGCEANGIELKNCPAYVREWITRERGST